MDLISLLEGNGLDRATAETVVSMAATKPIEEAEDLLKGVLGDSHEVSEYINSRKLNQLKKLEVKEDTHNGVIKNGRINEGVTRSGITVRSEPRKAKSSKSTVSNSEKVRLIQDLDAALSSLSVDIPNRHKCDCLGARHGLLEAAPNCLHCGRIVCNKEGLGPCLFCKKPLIPNEQMDQILEILESQKNGLMSTMSKKTLAQAGITASKVEKDSSMKAQAQLDRLLNYQSEDAVRTKIIDGAGEVDLPDVGVNRWASPAEQAEQLRKQQQLLRRLEHNKQTRSGLGRKVLSIDVKGNKIYTSVQDAEYESDDSAEEESEQQYSKIDAIDSSLEESDSKTVNFYDPKVFNRNVDFKLASQAHTTKSIGNWAEQNKVSSDFEAASSIVHHDEEIIY